MSAPLHYTHRGEPDVGQHSSWRAMLDTPDRPITWATWARIALIVAFFGWVLIQLLPMLRGENLRAAIAALAGMPQ